ncbi:MAG TPA: mersacidin/lichenicidin family type 2 lantibiotic [Thermoanaerobaculia bacterium]|nr:mersacidin/lichenicidin family type 2 lantibiotic [Thermoanaerobaculia bacterium]
MKKIDVVRAWRDEEYRNSLTEEERACLPENPAGAAVVEDSILKTISGGCGITSTKPAYCYSRDCFPGSTAYDSCVGPGEVCP